MRKRFLTIKSPVLVQPKADTEIGPKILKKSLNITLPDGFSNKFCLKRKQKQKTT